jgi:hypothetical protein
VARTDVVGSLLRPRKLLQAQERLERGEIRPPEFKRVEDAAVAEAIRLQEALAWPWSPTARCVACRFRASSRKGGVALAGDGQS